MCTRTVSTLARALEGAGLATVALLANRNAAELIGPPRGLYCEFPLGRPLGRPLDAGFQRDVLRAAFALLPKRQATIEDYGIVIEDEVDAPVSCPIPPRLVADEPAAIGEARALRAAYDRGVARIGTTQVGRVVDADGIPEAIRPFAEVADGKPWNEVSYPGGDPTTLLMDIRAYYEEAALGLSDEVPAARATESWYYRKTSAGALVRRYFEAVKDADPTFPGTFYVLPASQSDERLF